MADIDGNNTLDFFFTSTVGEETIDTLLSFAEGTERERFFVARIRGDGYFCYMCDGALDPGDFEKNSGHYIIDYAWFNDRVYIGHGIYHGDCDPGDLGVWISEAEARPYLDILNFTFYARKPESFFPVTGFFKGRFGAEGRKCYYMHRYLPVSRGKDATWEERKVRSLLFRFKDNEYIGVSGRKYAKGPNKASGLVATLVARAVESTNGLLPEEEKKDTVLMVIPASTAEKHERRFREFSKALSTLLGIGDGYPLLEVVSDREPGDVRRGMPVQENVRLKNYGEGLNGKHVLLSDDTYTSGKSFREMADFLEACDTLSITGIFLAKTEDKEIKEKV